MNTSSIVIQYQQVAQSRDPRYPAPSGSRPGHTAGDSKSQVGLCQPCSDQGWTFELGSETFGTLTKKLGYDLYDLPLGFTVGANNGISTQRGAQK